MDHRRRRCSGDRRGCRGRLRGGAQRWTRRAEACGWADGGVGSGRDPGLPGCADQRRCRGGGSPHAVRAVRR
ncbi:hypothetical protein C6A85_03775, partial [Mycobacterium sp. ITM-2017-0098]